MDRSRAENCFSSMRLLIPAPNGLLLELLAAKTAVVIPWKRSISNGEFYQVEEDEMERGLKIAVEQAAGRVPVYFGIGAINTRKCVQLAKMAAPAAYVRRVTLCRS